MAAGSLPESAAARRGRVLGNLRIGQRHTLRPIGIEIGEPASDQQQRQQDRADQHRGWAATRKPRARAARKGVAGGTAIAIERVDGGRFLKNGPIGRGALGPERIGRFGGGAPGALRFRFWSRMRSPARWRRSLLLGFFQLDPDPRAFRAGDIGDLGPCQAASPYPGPSKSASGEQRDDIAGIELGFEDRRGRVEKLVAGVFLARKGKDLLTLLDDDQSRFGGRNDQPLPVERGGHEAAIEPAVLAGDERGLLVGA